MFKNKFILPGNPSRDVRTFKGGRMVSKKQISNTEHTK